MLPIPVTDSSLGVILSKWAAYVNNTWWPQQGYPTAIPTLTWTSDYEREIRVRGAAMTAFALAVPGYTGDWRPGHTTPDMLLGVRNKAARLIAAVARQHVSNNPSGSFGPSWGRSWQSPLWAAWCGLAAMVGWDELIPNATERINVIRMLVDEADWVTASWEPLFWKDSNGVEIRPGNTGAEENAWASTVCWVASSFFPTDARSTTWWNQAIELSVCAFNTPQDMASDVFVGPLRVSDWIQNRGYNVRPDYLVENHGRIHPDYSTCVTMPLFGYVASMLGGAPRQYPDWLIDRVGRVWKALVSEPLDSQGTLAYNLAEPRVRFPSGTPNDWGLRRPAAYAQLDGLWSLLGPEQSVPSLRDLPVYWYRLHLGDVAAMQSRPTTAQHPFGAFIQAGAGESSYPAEESWAASQLAFLSLAEHLLVRDWAEFWYRKNLS
jgi:hypothetical protein